MPRFFVDPALWGGDTVTLSGDNHRHISLSLRMAVGESVTLSNGEGEEADGRILSMSATETVLALSDRRTGKGELPISVRLYQGNPKGDKLDLIVQKATELGADAILPFESSRCIARVVPARAEKQTARLSRIALEAAGQCGRARIPTVSLPLSFADALEDAKKNADAILFCYEEERTLSLGAALARVRAAEVRRLAVFVGAEGGFSPEEAERAVSCGAQSVSLGRRILRCETAPLYALSCIAMLFEDCVYRHFI